MKAIFNSEVVSFDQLWQSVESGEIKFEGKSHKWNTITSEGDHINFRQTLSQSNNVYTYALAEFESDESGERLWGLGSDDAVKVWLNGELVHENWAFRGVVNDNDLLTLNLKEGTNRLVVKVFNGVGGWGLSLRPVNMDIVSDDFVNSASTVSLETLDLLLNRGIDINKPNKLGLTAYQKARMRGLDIRALQLVERGADDSLPFPDVETVITSLFEQQVRENSSGLAYLVSQNGKIIAQGAHGFADVENGRELTVDSKFRIGSVTKQFAAVGLLRLQQKGMLSIEDSLSEYMPDFPRGDEVTLRQLLNHTSGIRSFTGVDGFLDRVINPIEQAQLVEEIKGYSYDFDPGSSWLYNNSGYFLVGALIEQVSGQSLSDFWQTEFFQPLGMTNTGIYVNGETYDDEALGYSRMEGDLQRALDWDMSHAGAAGNLYSTVGDLLKWNEALFGGRILSEEMFIDATTPARLANGEVTEAMGAYYGLGLSIQELDQGRQISHGGGLNGFLSNLARDVDLNINYITLSNSAPSDLINNGDTFKMVTNLVRGFESIDVVADVSTEFDESWYEYVGEYDYHQAINKVTIEDRRMYVQLTGQPRIEIFKSSDDAFYLKAVSAEFKFERDEAGTVIGGIHSQNGRTFKVKKMEPLVVADIDSSEYRKLLGDYKINSAVTISISLDEDSLYGQATGQGRFELLPLSRLEYRGKGINLKIVFDESEEEGIEGFTLYQSGMVMKAPKQ